MKAKATVITDCTKCFSLIGSHNSLCSILYNLQIIFLCNCTNLIHLTGYTGIMNRNDCFCLLRNRILNQPLINIHCFRMNINKYCLGTS